MKKLIVLLFLIVFSATVFSQGLFKPVPFFPTSSEKRLMISRGETPITQKWVWRFDASIAIAELSYNKETKQLISNAFSAVGPAVGYQHFIPTSVTDPTPFNNYGFSAAVLLGESIYNPQLASLKIALVADIMQYLKFGVTYTPNVPSSMSHFGLFLGGGITF